MNAVELRLATMGDLHTSPHSERKASRGADAVTLLATCSYCKRRKKAHQNSKSNAFKQLKYDIYDFTNK